MDKPPGPILVRRIGHTPYLPTLEAMRTFTRERDASTRDEIWLLEHPPVFTQGFAGDAGFVHDAGRIPVVRTERGGQVTYHGPGQLVAYLLVDLRRRRLGVRDFVCRVEQALIDYLASVGIAAGRRERAPGVYLLDDGTRGAKIASIGLKISHGRSYHGLALNVAMDLEPFDRIDPCGMPGLAVTDMRSQGVVRSVAEAGEEFVAFLLPALGAEPVPASAIIGMPEP
jgi:lipoyl(octanoyl) transferase